MTLTNITRDRWHDRENISAIRLLNRYQRPSAWFRRSVYYPDRTFESEHINEDFIRAAVVFHRRSQWKNLIDIPWTLVVFPPNEQFVILIGSMPDPDQWIEQARRQGAWAWWLTDSTRVWAWSPKMEVEDPTENYNETIDVSRHRYDVTGVSKALHLGQETDEEIAARFDISRYTVHRLKKKLGLVVAAPRRTRPKLNVIEIKLKTQ